MSDEQNEVLKECFLYKTLARRHMMSIISVLYYETKPFAFNELKNKITINQSNLSKNLKDLEELGVIDRFEVKKGRVRYVYYQSNEFTKKVVDIHKTFETLEKECIENKKKRIVSINGFGKCYDCKWSYTKSCEKGLTIGCINPNVTDQEFQDQLKQEIPCLEYDRRM